MGGTCAKSIGGQSNRACTASLSNIRQGDAPADPPADISPLPGMIRCDAAVGQVGKAENFSQSLEAANNPKVSSLNTFYMSPFLSV